MKPFTAYVDPQERAPPRNPVVHARDRSSESWQSSVRGQRRETRCSWDKMRYTRGAEVAQAYLEAARCRTPGEEPSTHLCRTVCTHPLATVIALLCAE